MLLLYLGVAAGCRTAPRESTREIAVVLASDGTVTLAGKRVDLGKLPARLQSAGAGPRTAIVVEAPKGVSPALMTEVTKTLVGANYRRVLFRLPRQAEAYAGPPPPAPAPARAPKPSKSGR